MIELRCYTFFTFMSPLGFKTSLASASCFAYCLMSLFFMITINEMETTLLQDDIAVSINKRLTFVLFQLLKASRIEDGL